MAAVRTVAAVCDVELLAVGLEDALAGADDFEFVGSAQTSRGALELVRDAVEPVVVVAGADLARVVRELHVARGDLVVVAIGPDDSDTAHQVLQLGARAYMSEEVELGAVAEALRQAAGGIVYRVVPEARPGDPAEWDDLTDRELAILRFVAEGMPNRAIARRLGVTEQTVKFHLTNVFRKLGVANRTAAARWAYEHGLASSGTRDDNAG